MYQMFEEGIKVSKESPMAKFHLGKFAHLAKGDFTLIEARINFKGLEKIRAANPNEKIVYLEIEEPNRFNSWDKAFRREEYENYFYKIFSLCPYTTKWLNEKEKSHRRTTIFYPFDEAYIPAKTEKKYDVIYVGNILAGEIERNVETLRKFNYRLVADYMPNGAVTDLNVSYEQKLKLISETKISIVHNVLILGGRYINAIQGTKDWEQNAAWREVPRKHWWSLVWNRLSKREYLVPQIKTRMFEAAFARSLILCRRDPFNEIERFFVPGKEFVYYEDGKLEEKIREILAHYEDYLPIIENAFKKATAEYTTKRFFEEFLRDLT